MEHTYYINKITYTVTRSYSGEACLRTLLVRCMVQCLEK